MNAIFSVVSPFLNCIGLDAKSYTADAITSLSESLMEISTSLPFHALLSHASAEKSTVAISVLPLDETPLRLASGVVVQVLLCSLVLDLAVLPCDDMVSLRAGVSSFVWARKFHATRPATIAITATIAMTSVFL